MRKNEDSSHSTLSRLDFALFQGKVQGAVVSFYQNERPPRGLVGLLDWHFQGVISHCIQRGAITGNTGECIYLPLSKGKSVYHLILAGAGHSSSPGVREPLPSETLDVLQKNLTTLKIPRIGISKSDFGNINEQFFEKFFKGVPLWIAH